MDIFPPEFQWVIPNNLSPSLFPNHRTKEKSCWYRHPGFPHDQKAGILMNPVSWHGAKQRTDTTLREIQAGHFTSLENHQQHLSSLTKGDLKRIFTFTEEVITDKTGLSWKGVAWDLRKAGGTCISQLDWPCQWVCSLTAKLILRWSYKLQSHIMNHFFCSS